LGLLCQVLFLLIGSRGDSVRWQGQKMIILWAPARINSCELEGGFMRFYPGRSLYGYLGCRC
jgi:prepilin signal peptidase PulO-like enzyme (type II secretory pathway)